MMMTIMPVALERKWTGNGCDRGGTSSNGDDRQPSRPRNRTASCAGRCGADPDTVTTTGGDGNDGTRTGAATNTPRQHDPPAMTTQQGPVAVPSTQRSAGVRRAALGGTHGSSTPLRHRAHRRLRSTGRAQCIHLPVQMIAQLCRSIATAVSGRCPRAGRPASGPPRTDHLGAQRTQRIVVVAAAAHHSALCACDECRGARVVAARVARRRVCGRKVAVDGPQCGTGQPVDGQRARRSRHRPSTVSEARRRPRWTAGRIIGRRIVPRRRTGAPAAAPVAQASQTPAAARAAQLRLIAIRRNAKQAAGSVQQRSAGAVGAGPSRAVHAHARAGGRRTAHTRHQHEWGHGPRPTTRTATTYRSGPPRATTALAMAAYASSSSGGQRRVAATSALPTRG